MRDFLVVEMRLEQLIIGVGGVGLGDPRQRFGPTKDRALAVSEQRRVAPGVEQMDTHVAFAMLGRILTVHIDAKGAAVDMRRAQTAQLDKPMIEAWSYD